MLPTIRRNREMESPMEALLNRGDLFNFDRLLDTFDSNLRQDDEGNKVLEIDVPGFNEENLQINKDGNIISVSGENGRGRRIEKSMTAPADTDDVKANVQDGVLEITFHEEGKGNRKEIPIND